MGVNGLRGAFANRPASSGARALVVRAWDNYRIFIGAVSAGRRDGWRGGDGSRSYGLLQGWCLSMYRRDGRP